MRLRLLVALACGLSFGGLACDSDDDSDGGGGGSGTDCACVDCMEARCPAEVQQMCGPSSASGECRDGDCAAYESCMRECETTAGCGCDRCGCADEACTRPCHTECASEITTDCQSAVTALASCTIQHCMAECDDGSGGTGGTGGTGGSGGGIGTGWCDELGACCENPLQPMPDPMKQSCELYAGSGNEEQCWSTLTSYKTMGYCP